MYWEHFAAARAKRAELVANLDYVHGVFVLKDGAAKAHAVTPGLETRPQGKRPGVSLQLRLRITGSGGNGGAFRSSVGFSDSVQDSNRAG